MWASGSASKSATDDSCVPADRPARVVTAVLRVTILVLIAVGLSACGSPGQPRSFNLAGYSAVYKRAHADGCASVGGSQRRDDRQYRADADYMMGWNDGRDACR